MPGMIGTDEYRDPIELFLQKIF